MNRSPMTATVQAAFAVQKGAKPWPARRSKVLIGRFLSGCLALGLSAPAVSAETPVAATFVTLGTAGGPVPNPLRSQPANAIVVGRDVTMVDVGDGAVERLAQAGYRLDQVRAVVISHLHLDHTAGLAGIIGLRWMNDIHGSFRIVGPPGTRAVVDGIVASLAPSRKIGFGLSTMPSPRLDPIDVLEVSGGETLTLSPGIQLRTVENCHYSFAAGSPEAREQKSISYRFDVSGRSIAYTGDTGPCPPVTGLAAGADLLVSEIQDLPALERLLSRTIPDMPADVRKNILEHLRRHHLSAEDVGEMAATAKVKAVVLTHLAPAPAAAEADAMFLPGVRAKYRGPVTVAADLGRY